MQNKVKTEGEGSVESLPLPTVTNCCSSAKQETRKKWHSRFAYYAVILPETLFRPEIVNIIDWFVEQSDLSDDCVGEGSLAWN
ncbi:hypothetical protein TI10_08515 [Photorhabdus luminescens subsp. luminescens]|uniref:hypothetical protein n=1 Tax=Photorhabdus TaxID=29487 RepID=UPI00066D6A4B|nr:hypothetical protein [Photorhabdus luminescens]KMW73152.1 hypothetical protein TI10_08515 [Photorhabdus luminescens subsp. luminescens]OWO81579.1 hypothetical protein B5C26_13065 [Photorhabdus luminescens]